MAKYIKLMDGLKSNAGGFQYKIGEMNVANNWNPTTFDPVVMGGFNFSTEEKILRTNKIILSNPRKLTEDMVMEYYTKSNLPIKTYYQCLIVMLYKNYIDIAKKIIEDKVNKNNIDDCISEFERMISDKHDGSTPIFNYDKLWQEAKEIYDILLNIKNS